MDLLRTPDACFENLPDGALPEPGYVDVDAGDGMPLRVAVHDLGPRDAPTVLCLHGEPSWSYLYRHVARELLDAGCRVVVPDLVGFGRSDKPTRVEDHTYAAHVAWMQQALFGQLDLTDVTLLCQDWGGLIGLRLLGDAPQRFAGVVAANTGLPDGERDMPEVWHRFKDFVQRTEDLPVGFLVAGAVVKPMTDEVRAAYEAPFPSKEFKAGPRAMPPLIPRAPTDPGADENKAAWKVLQTFEKPFVCAFSDSDPITRGADGPMKKLIPGAQGREHPVLVGGGHFLQEDVPSELAAVTAAVAWGRS